MNKVKNLGFVLAGMALLALTLISPSSAAPGPQNVNIVSPLTSGAVTVGGTVNVGNTPSVSISGTPTVNVASLPTVNAAQSGVWMVDVNGVALVRDDDNPARQPYQAAIDVDLVNLSSQTCTSFNVPADHELVIEYFSAEAHLPTGQKVLRFEVAPTVGGSTIIHRFGATFQGTEAGGLTDQFITSQETRLYVDPGLNKGQACIFRNSSSGAASADVSISGYLVALP
ncbi:MAG: hypothetical protein ACRD35_09255 [Candidatus Acidiferrales bacterium]